MKGTAPIAVLLWAPVCALAAVESGTWVAMSGDTPPDGAVVVGHAQDGYRQYICRAMGRAELIGTLGNPSAGCRVGLPPRERAVMPFEVLVVAQRSDFSRADAAIRADGGTVPRAAEVTRPDASAVGARIGVAVGTRATRDGVPAGTVAGSTSSAGTVPPPPFGNPACSGLARPREAGEGAIRNEPGIDAETGRPYVDAVFADGTVRRIQERGVTVMKPGQSPVWCPYQFLAANAPSGNPPELPADPMRGRRWLELHNSALRDVIRALVADDAVLQAIDAAEQRDAGDDLFGQISYRTGIASFYANQTR